MKYPFIWLLLFLFFSHCLAGQIKPAEGSRLNYTLAGFSIVPRNNATEYTFEVSRGNFTDEKKFKKNKFLSQNSIQAKAVIQLPAFGELYTWRVVCRVNGKEVRTPLYHFATDTSEYVNPSKHRLRVLSNTYTDSPLLFFLDYSRCLFNEKGEPAWFLPNIDPYLHSNMMIRDLKFTPDGTITFLSDTGAYEIDYDAHVLWRAQKPGGNGGGRGDRTRFFHHEFTKLKNGSYLLLGTEVMSKKIPPIDTSILKNEFAIEKRGDDYYKKIDFGTVLLFDSSNHFLWGWRSAQYFTDADLFGEKTESGMFRTTTHMNGCYFDEERNVIYVGFRDINRVVKISYPEGKVLGEYGDGVNSIGNGKFEKQHSYSINEKGNLCIFNNNVAEGDTDRISKVMVFREPQNAKDSLETLWEFYCDIDKEAPATGQRGGNVVPLKDDNYIVSMGGSPRVFIVNERKGVLFNAVAEQWNVIEKTWTPFPQYRVNAIYKTLLYKSIYANSK